MKADQPSSEVIFARLLEAAKRSPRGEARLETLYRLKTACDDIASGCAADVARRAGDDPGLFPKSMPWINPRKVYQYIKLRRRLEGEANWPGPHETTLKNTDLKQYLDARNIEARGLSRLPPKQSRKRKISEIVSRITPPTDRYSVLAALEEAGVATDRFRIAREMIKQLKGIDLDAMVDAGTPPQDDARTELSTGQRQVLVMLIRQLTDQSALSEFGLFYDGSRVKMQGGTGATLVSKSAIDLLRALAGSARESGST